MKGDFFMIKKYNGINLLITIGLIFVFLVLGLIHSISDSNPLNSDTVPESRTGVISKYYQYDEQWYDDLLNSTNGSYFAVRLEDDSYFEATGAIYDQIDKKLFEEIREDEEITVTYFRKDGGIRKICAIEYKGQTYLSLEEVLDIYEELENSNRNLEKIIFIISVTTAILLYLVNYVKYRNYIKKKKQNIPE